MDLEKGKMLLLEQKGAMLVLRLQENQPSPLTGTKGFQKTVLFDYQSNLLKKLQSQE